MLVVERVDRRLRWSFPLGNTTLDTTGLGHARIEVGEYLVEFCADLVDVALFAVSGLAVW